VGPPNQQLRSRLECHVQRGIPERWQEGPQLQPVAHASSSETDCVHAGGIAYSNGELLDTAFVSPSGTAGGVRGAAMERPSKIFYTRDNASAGHGARVFFADLIVGGQCAAQLGKGLRVELRKAVMRSRMEERRW
jgi:hypothetical protein